MAMVEGVTVRLFGKRLFSFRISRVLLYVFLTAFVIFFILLFAGVPIAFSMGLGSLIGLMADGSANLSVVAQRLFSGRIKQMECVCIRQIAPIG